MATTSRFGLPYPGIDDEPNGPDQVQDLAEAVDAQLSRLKAYPTAGRPVGVPAGFAIYDDDLAAPFYWDGAVWVPFGTGSGGGGDTPSGVGGRWEQSDAQPIPATSSGPGTIVSFPNGSGTGITQEAEGAGHEFILASSGVYVCGALVRVQSSSAAGEVSCAIRAKMGGAGSEFSTTVAMDGGRREGLPRTLQPSKPRWLPANTRLAVFVFNGTGSERRLEPRAGDWVNLDIWRVG
jgi:hypothetical protein